MGKYDFTLRVLGEKLQEVGGNQATGRAITVKAVPVSLLEHKLKQLNRGKKCLY